jgi:hypothetical protein
MLDELAIGRLLESQLDDFGYEAPSLALDALWEKQRANPGSPSSPPHDQSEMKESPNSALKLRQD